MTSGEFGWAEEHVSSGLASIYNAATPLIPVLVALIALPEERPSRTKMAGLLTGFAGVAGRAGAVARDRRQ
jgi:drug/metabolite transporter (DMT)-like permease